MTRNFFNLFYFTYVATVISLYVGNQFILTAILPRYRQLRTAEVFSSVSQPDRKVGSPNIHPATKKLLKMLRIVAR